MAFRGFLAQFFGRVFGIKADGRGGFEKTIRNQGKQYEIKKQKTARLFIGGRTLLTGGSLSTGASGVKYMSGGRLPLPPV